jgi:hypothetical protein
MDDEEEILDWLTNPENMEMTDSIERANRKMFEKIRKASDYLAVFFCKFSYQFQLKFVDSSDSQIVTIANSAHEFSLKSNTLMTKLTAPESTS